MIVFWLVDWRWVMRFGKVVSSHFRMPLGIGSNRLVTRGIDCTNISQRIVLSTHHYSRLLTIIAFLLAIEHLLSSAIIVASILCYLFPILNLTADHPFVTTIIFAITVPTFVFVITLSTCPITFFIFPIRLSISQLQLSNST